MEIKVNIEYDQILELIQQLPEEKLTELIETLQDELKVKKLSSKEKLKQLILEAPSWTEQQLKDFQETRDSINSSRLG
ncbi:hypothetical protein WJR50_18765 [Catalinimonas sp. 4WD22]